MAEVNLTCIQKGVFRGMSESDMTALDRFKIGDVMKVKPVMVRNPKFMKKFFALLNVGFDSFEPVTEHKGQVIQKNYERFRKDVTIMAGFYTVTVDINGAPKYEADSISFANMDEGTFEDLYSKVANVILEKVLTNYTRDDLDNTVNQILGFV